MTEPNNVLLLTHRVPFPPDKGDRILTYHLLKYLAARARVHLACPADEATTSATVARLEPLCVRMTLDPLGRGRWPRALASWLSGRTLTEGAFHSPQLLQTVRRWAEEVRFNACLAVSSSMLQYLDVPGLAGVPTVAHLVDVDSQKWLDLAAATWGPRAWLYRTEGRRLRRLERGLPARVRAVVLVSEAEANVYRGFCAPGNVCVVPNGVDTDYFHPAEAQTSADCVFVGALDYLPNSDGIRWLCREVWPKVRRQRPDARLRIVGRNPSHAVRRLGTQAGVDVVGPVPDVRPYLANAGIAVVPLRLARGVQNKVLEALAMGKAVVATSPALAALDVHNEVDVLCADGVDAWTDAIVRLLTDAGLRRRLGAAGRKYVEQRHHWDTCLARLDPLLGLAAPSAANSMAGNVSVPLPIQ